MSKWTKFGAMTLALTVAAACGDDNGPGGSLSQAEKTALANALADTDFGGLAAYVIQVVGEVGTLDPAAATSAVNTALANALSLSSTGALSASYEGAVGIALQFDYDVQGEPPLQGWFYGVFGWNDVNTSNSTVGEWVLVGGFGEDTALPSSASGRIEDLDVFADYGNNNVIYSGTSGEASVSSSSFSGSTDCSASQGGFTVACTYSVGTMNGNFLFQAQQVEPVGTGTYTQPKVQFSNLPALRMILTISQ